MNRSLSHPQQRKALPPPAIDGARWIPLTKGNFALVDDADYPLVMEYTWCCLEGKYTTYAQSRSGGKCTLLHRLVMGFPGSRIDHRNGDGLDNRKGNLRVVSNGANMANARRPITNKSGFKGVSWHAQRRKWRASIQVNGRQCHLGLFEDPMDAAEAYDKAAVLHFGEHALTNRHVQNGES